MKDSATTGVMLLLMILAVSFGVAAAENTNMTNPNMTNGMAMLINATSPGTMTPMMPMSMMTMPMNESMGMPESMASKSPTTLILQNVTLNLIVIGNLTEITSTIIPQNAIDTAKNATLAPK